MPGEHSCGRRSGFGLSLRLKGGYLLGGRMVDDGPIFERFSDALNFFNAVIALNIEANRDQ
jgi:hypothetical protein